MSRLDIMVCVQELKNAIGAHVENLYEIDGAILMSLRHDGERLHLLCGAGRRIGLTRRRPEVPKKPSSFAMLLRKHLAGATLSGIEQPGLERVVLLEFFGNDKRYLAVELFGRGNFVLCDGSKAVIHPYRQESWRGRVIRAGEPYLLPPGPRIAPDAMDADWIRKQIRGSPDLVRALAVNLGLGGTLAEEICARSGLGRGVPPESLSDDDIKALLGSISGVFTSEPDPMMVYDNGKPVDVLPFGFRIYLGMEVRKFSSFNEALDEYFTGLAVASAAERARKKLEAEIERLKRILVDEQAGFSRLYERSAEMKRKADVISLKHQFVEGILDQVRKALKKAGFDGAIDLIRSAAASGAWWAPAVKAVRRSGEAVIELSGEEVKLDLSMSAFQNASRYYEEYKRLAEKAAGAKRVAERTAAELERLNREGLTAVRPVRKEAERLWFERYRWALSSGGFLILSGRDEKTSSEIVKKRMGQKDIYLHAEIRGAPHAIIRSEGREVPEDDIREAAEFAAMHSRAWGEGIGTLRVFWARPEQVSGRAPSGMYLPRGSFMVTGERRYIDVPLRAAVGVIGLEGREAVMCGPVSAVKRHSKATIEVLPGSMDKREAAREIRERLASAGHAVSVEDVERALPPGGCRIVA